MRRIVSTAGWRCETYETWQRVRRSYVVACNGASVILDEVRGGFCLRLAGQRWHLTFGRRGDR